MKKVILLMVLVLVVGCGMNITGPSVLVEKTSVQTEQSFNLDVVITVGNHSYIPINARQIEVLSTKLVPTILNLLDAFEKKHPNLEVTGWDLLQSQADSSSVYGLWVDHKPKQ